MRGQGEGARGKRNERRRNIRKEDKKIRAVRTRRLDGKVRGGKRGEISSNLGTRKRSRRRRREKWRWRRREREREGEGKWRETEQFG